MRWEQNVRRVTPYVPGEQPKVTGEKIKLNTNENPYPPAPGVKKAMEAFKEDTLRLYPSPTCDELREVLANRYHVTKERVFVGVGSDDVLATAFLAFFNSEEPILFPDVTYSFYPVWANLYRIPFETKPLDSNFRLCKEDYFGKNGGVVIANPNAPTSIYEPLSNIEEIIRNNPDVVVIIDEAYIDFGGESALQLVDKYSNLLVVQTFSKSRSMAGLRIGFAIGSEKLIGYLNDVKFSINSYTMNQPALAYAIAAVEDEAYFQQTTQAVINTRANAEKTLRQLGFDVAESSTNFLFVSHPSYEAAYLQQKLRERNIFVRYFSDQRINRHLRISVGTDREMQILFDALSNIISQ